MLGWPLVPGELSPEAGTSPVSAAQPNFPLLVVPEERGWRPRSPSWSFRLVWVHWAQVKERLEDQG